MHIVKSQSLESSNRQNERRIKILGAAERLYGRYGFEKTTVFDIAKEASISRASLYLEFSNKEQILWACIEKNLNDTLARMQKIAHQSSQSSSSQYIAVLENIILEHILSAYDHSNHHCKSQILLEKMSSKVFTEMDLFFKAQDDLFMMLLENAAKAREIPKQNYKQASEMIGLAMRAFLPPASNMMCREIIEKDARKFFKFFLNGLKTP